MAQSQIGYTVLLSDGRKCLVEEINTAALSRPRLRYEDEIVDLSKKRELTIQAII